MFFYIESFIYICYVCVYMYMDKIILVFSI